MKPSPCVVQVDEDGPQTFRLTVLCGDQRFDCGTYITRPAALQAGRLFVQRKEAEAASGRTRRKPGKG